jgi:hypothetical protein
MGIFAIEYDLGSSPLDLKFLFIYNLVSVVPREPHGAPLPQAYVPRHNL